MAENRNTTTVKVLKHQAVILRALRTWGVTAQMVKTIEECAELIQVLSKKLNGNPNVTDQHIIDEIADVTIMVLQMQMIFGPVEVTERMDYKIERTEAALNRFDESKAKASESPKGQTTNQGDNVCV